MPKLLTTAEIEIELILEVKGEYDAASPSTGQPRTTRVTGVEDLLIETRSYGPDETRPGRFMLKSTTRNSVLNADGSVNLDKILAAFDLELCEALAEANAE